MGKKFVPYLDTYLGGMTTCHYSPFYIYLELTNHCNRRCSNCINKDMRRKKGYMSEETYRVSLKQIKESDIEWVYLFHTGESSLHPEIEQVIDLAKSLGLKVRLHTNGDVDISSFAYKIDRLFISINDGLSEKAKENIKILKSSKVKYKLWGIDGISPEITGEDIVIKNENSCWRDTRTEDNIQSCSQTYKSMSILYDGSCVPCSLDYEKDYILGQIKEERLLGIWNGQKMKDLRDPNIQLPEMCKHCNMRERI